MSVRIERNGPVTTILLNRPEVKNAIDRATAEALTQAFRDFEADSSANVAVLHGEGGIFCSGADLKAMASGNPNQLSPEGDGPLGPTRMQISKPVIAAIAGHAVAGGLELAIWCDLRVAEEDAIFGIFCRRWGVPLIDGGTVRLPRLIGLSHALDMILTGRAVGAEEALRMGLANRVVPKGTSRRAAEELAAQIAAFPQTCMRNDRRSAYAQEGKNLEDAMKYEYENGIQSIPDMVEGLSRYMAGAGRHGKF